MADLEVVEGVVDEALPNTLFRVKLGSGEVVLALSGRENAAAPHQGARGDRVQVQLDPYGGRARITRRG